MQTFQFNTIEEALEDFRQGKMVIVVDDGDAENDGALAVAGQFATPEAVNFMLSHGRGLMTMPISEEIAGKIGVAELIWENRELSRSTATVTIDSVHVSVGVSAADRSQTVMEAAAEGASPDGFRRPGSIVPKVALQGGVLKRTGFTEATVAHCIHLLQTTPLLTRGPPPDTQALPHAATNDNRSGPPHTSPQLQEPWQTAASSDNKRDPET